MGIRAEFETITPEIAWDLLNNHNKKNRTIRATTVEMYMRDIKNGNWEENGDPIQIDSNGNIKNGQHRLMAVYKANIPVKFLVVRGVDPNVNAFDVGAKRSVSDVMKLSGHDAYHSNPSYVGMVTFIIGKLKGGRNTKISASEVSEFIDRYKKHLDIAYRAFSPNGTPVRTKSAPIMAAAFFTAHAGVDEKVISAFAESLRTGFVTCDEENAVICFRNMILAGDVRASGGVSRDRMFEVAQAALKDYANGKSRKKRYQTGTNYYLDEFKKGYKA